MLFNIRKVYHRMDNLDIVCGVKALVFRYKTEGQTIGIVDNVGYESKLEEFQYINK
jgi:hypothetical protein